MTTPRHFLAAVLALLLGAGCSSNQYTMQTQPLASSSESRTSSRASLAERIDGLLADSLFPPANAGIAVVALQESTFLYERNSRLLFTPASNQKLFTSATALAVLGPYFHLNTIMAVDSASRRIYLKGGGDPLLSNLDLDTLALAARKVIGGPGSWTVVGDVSRFDSLYWGKGWMWDDVADPDGMAVSALCVNANTVEVHVRAGRTPGEPPVVTVLPPTAYVRVVNSAVITVDSVVQPLTITRSMQRPTNTIIVSGQMLPGQTKSTGVAVWEPERYALTLFRESLERTGIRCSATVLDTLPQRIAATARVSRRLDTVITYMNKVSDNLSAECLLKNLGAVSTGGQGTWENGTAVVRRFLSTIGVDTTRIVVADGSGLSRYNLTSAETISKLLVAMGHVPGLFPTYLSSLPVAGEDGTLSRRMRGTGAERVLHAKTGTVSGVSSLSGYTTTRNGTVVVFSMLMQNFAGSSQSYRMVQDSIGRALSEWEGGLAGRALDGRSAFRR